MYDEGRGVKIDYAKAVYWFEKATEQGYARAQFNLGLMYGRGDGIKQDHKRAVHLYEKAATQGDVGAQLVLGLAYFRGDGVTQDYVKAHMWTNIASKNGLGIESRDKIAKEMTQAQLTKAQEMAKQCVASNYQNCN